MLTLLVIEAYKFPHATKLVGVYNGGARQGLGAYPPQCRPAPSTKGFYFFCVIGYLAYFHSVSPTRPRSGSTISYEHSNIYKNKKAMVQSTCDNVFSLRLASL